MPVVKVSIQAATLHMACEAEFGSGNHGKLDHLTVSMSHPDGNRRDAVGRLRSEFAFHQPALHVPAA